MTRKRSGQRGAVSQRPATTQQPTGAASTIITPVTVPAAGLQASATTAACQSRPTTPPRTSAVPRAAISPPSRAKSPTTASSGAAAAPAAAGSSDAATAAGDSAPPQTDARVAKAIADAQRFCREGTAYAMLLPEVAEPGETSTPASVELVPASREYGWLSKTPDELVATSDEDTLRVFHYLSSYWPDERRDEDPHKLDSRVNKLMEQREYSKAHPLLCKLACYSFLLYGERDMRTYSAVCDVLTVESKQGSAVSCLRQWMMPRLAAMARRDDPGFRQLVQQAAVFLTDSLDPRKHLQFTQTVTQLAQQLPGGLGWGNTVVAPVPDEDAYYQHVVLQAQSDRAFEQGHFKLCSDMLQRCVAYFDTLGQHWLATARKVKAMATQAMCVSIVEGKEAAEPLFLQAKQTCQNQLGPRHDATLFAMVQCAGFLLHDKRYEAAFSVYQKILQIRRDVGSDWDVDYILYQSTMAGVLSCLNRFDAAKAALDDALERAVKVAGPRAQATQGVLWTYANLLETQGKARELDKLVQRAKKLGCC